MRRVAGAAGLPRLQGGACPIALRYSQSSRVLLCMVGLPARGKSYITKMLMRYLTPGSHWNLPGLSPGKSGSSGKLKRAALRPKHGQQMHAAFDLGFEMSTAPGRWSGFPVKSFNAGNLRRQGGAAPNMPETRNATRCEVKSAGSVKVPNPAPSQNSCTVYSRRHGRRFGQVLQLLAGGHKAARGAHARETKLSILVQLRSSALHELHVPAAQRLQCATRSCLYITFCATIACNTSAPSCRLLIRCWCLRQRSCCVVSTALIPYDCSAPTVSTRNGDSACETSSGCIGHCSLQSFCAAEPSWPADCPKQRRL